jgi:hypothetical protein
VKYGGCLFQYIERRLKVSQAISQPDHRKPACHRPMVVCDIVCRLLKSTSYREVADGKLSDDWSHQPALSEEALYT